MEEEPVRTPTAIFDVENAMIESIEFTNFKALRKTMLPLAPFTLLLGPNGSGKTTVLQALQLIASFIPIQVDGNGRLLQKFGIWSSLLSVTAEDRNTAVIIKLRLRLKEQVVVAEFQISPDGTVTKRFAGENGTAMKSDGGTFLPSYWLGGMQTFSLDSATIAEPFPVSSGPLQPNGRGLAAVLDDLKDNHP